MSVDSISKRNAQAGSEATCSECGTTEDWRGSSWCPVCGFYPSINRAVGPAQPPRVPSPPVAGRGDSRIANWKLSTLLGMAAIVLIAIVLRIYAPDELRNLIAAAMTVLGSGFALFAHFSAYKMMRTRVGGEHLLSIFTQAIAVWKLVFQEIEDEYPKVWCGVWGIVTTIMGLFVVGDLNALTVDGLAAVKNSPRNDQNYSETTSGDNLRTTEVAQRIESRDARRGHDFVGDSTQSQPNQSRSPRGSSRRHDQRFDRTGTASVPVSSENDQAELNSEVKRATDYLPTVDCAIMGFCPRADRSIKFLIVAGVVDDELKCLGQVSVESLTESERLLLASRLHDLVRKAPFIETYYDATWVEPKIRVRVAFLTLRGGSRLTAARVKMLLPDI